MPVTLREKVFLQQKHFHRPRCQMPNRADTGSGGSTLQALDRGLRVIAELARAPELGVTALARLVGVNKSTVYRILTTLKSHRFVSQNPVTGKYALGIRAFEVGAAVANRFGLLERASPEMELLAQRFNETVNLAVLDQSEIVYLHKIESSEPLRLGLRVGTRVPAYCSALGKVLLASLDPHDLAEWLAKVASHGRFEVYTPRTISDSSALAGELEAIRRRGYSVDDEEYRAGIRCVAAPVHDHMRRPIAAVSVAGPAFRLTMTRVTEEIGPALAEACARISQSLGYGAYPPGGPFTPKESRTRGPASAGVLR
jgi:DNA-binding IclR family transcriptional regulator